MRVKEPMRLDRAFVAMAVRNSSGLVVVNMLLRDPPTSRTVHPIKRVTQPTEWE